MMFGNAHGCCVCALRDGSPAPKGCPRQARLQHSRGPKGFRPTLFAGSLAWRRRLPLLDHRYFKGDAVGELVDGKDQNTGQPYGDCYNHAGPNDDRILPCRQAFEFGRVSTSASNS